MRQICHGKQDWLDIKWKGGVIAHTTQTDSFSCGVFVMQMANTAVQNFPKIPNQIHIGSSKPEIKELRRKMAAEILDASVFDESKNCSLCSSDPGSGQTTS
ncbi:hypothetical protein DPEC_G00192430 [Dallia pectoralis]|uniref:Uncharacterized protein n=1 Tax=Dallia pectoralis TaxID=75939 RepID=A0ACC2GCQ1_DALPE|nr:hypothetical protein DPEC_G00192430 [Dallia pectoralis]